MTDPPPASGPRSEQPASDRRFGDRFAVEWSVDCTTEDTFLYAAITNISEMGIFVACDAPFEVGTAVSLRFQPRPEDPPFVLPGRVQWVNRLKPFGHCRNPGMGVQFVALSPEDRERIVEIVHTIAYVRDYQN